MRTLIIGDRRPRLGGIRAGFALIDRDRHNTCEFERQQLGESELREDLCDPTFRNTVEKVLKIDFE